MVTQRCEISLDYDLQADCHLSYTIVLVDCQMVALLVPDISTTHPLPHRDVQDFSLALDTVPVCFQDHTYNRRVWGQVGTGLQFHSVGSTTFTQIEYFNSHCIAT